MKELPLPERFKPSGRYQIFVSVTEDIVAVGAVLREVQRLALEDGHQIGQPVHHLLAGSQLRRIVEVRKVRQR